MLRKVRFLSVILLTAVFFTAGSESLGARSPNGDLLVSRQLLERVGLESDWQVNLPMKSPEKITRMYVFDKYLYVLSSMNYMYCIDTEKKAVRFGLQLAARGLPINDPCYYDGELWFMVGNELVVLAPKTGSIAMKKRLKSIGRSVVSGLSRNKKHLYVAGSDRRLHAIAVDGFWQMFMVAADNGSQINSAVADDAFVVFTTEAGNVTRVLATEAKRKWQYDVIGRITAPIVRDGDWVYVSSRNAKLCKLGINRGKAGWEDSFHAGAPLKKSVVVGKDVVYQAAGEKGLYAVDKESGKEVWHVSKGVDLLVEIGQRAYVYAKGGVLVAMDNTNGEELYRVNIGDVERYAVNTTDESLYMADFRGRVMCVKEKHR